MPDARVILVPSIQYNRLYPEPGDGLYSKSEGEFAEWFCGVKLLPALKAAGIDTVIDQGAYKVGDDLGPLYEQRSRIVAYAKSHPAQKILVVSIHTEGTAYEPNLFGGRYLGNDSSLLLSRIADKLEGVHATGAWRYEYKSPGYILLDGYPANCVCAIVEVAGDSTVDKVRFLSTQADRLAFAVKNGIVSYLGGAPVPPPVDYEALYRAEKKRADDLATRIEKGQHIQSQAIAKLNEVW